MADRAMVLKLMMGSKSVFYELYSTSKERFALDETMYFVTMKKRYSWLYDFSVFRSPGTKIYVCRPVLVLS